MFEKIQNNWPQIQEYVKNNSTEIISGVVFETFIKPMEPYKLVKDSDGSYTLQIIVPEAPMKEFIKKKYSLFVKVAIEEVTGIKCKLDIYTNEEIETPDIKESLNKGIKEISPSLIERSNLNPLYTFENFVIGKNNNLAHAASVAVAESPGDIYNPLFIYGRSGLGKTHLMQAIAHFVLSKNPNKKVLYVTCENFTNELIESIKNKKQEEFHNKYRKIDVLLLDDIQFIIGKESTQEEVFYTFEALHGSKKQIIISSDRPQENLATLDERLIGRFKMGLTVDVQSPDYETRVAILRKKEEISGYNVPDDVIKYIATIVNSNIREIEGALTKVVAKSKLEKVEINLDMATEALKDISDPSSVRVITPEKVIQVVCEHFSITSEDLIGSKRNKELVYPRQIAMYLIRKYTNVSLDMAGEHLGGRDHATIIHGIKKIESELNVNNEIKSTVDIIVKKLCPQ